MIAMTEIIVMLALWIICGVVLMVLLAMVLFGDHEDESETRLSAATRRRVRDSIEADIRRDLHAAVTGERT